MSWKKIKLRTCYETSLSFVGIRSSLKQLHEIVQPDDLEIIEPIQKELANRACEAHGHGGCAAPYAVGPPLRVLAMCYGRHGESRRGECKR